MNKRQKQKKEKKEFLKYLEQETFRMLAGHHKIETEHFTFLASGLVRYKGTIGWDSDPNYEATFGVVYKENTK